MREHKVTCDTCGRDITSTGNSVDYRLDVVNVSLHSQRGEAGEMFAVTDMMIYPPLKRDHHFCDLRCLQGHWIATGKPAE